MPTRIYVDTSAVATLFIAEQETPDLRQWLSDRPTPHLVSSALPAMGLLRLLRLVDPTTVLSAERFLAAGVDIVEITPPVLGDATTVPPPRLRTLDAIHLATALDLGTSVDVHLTYDKALLEAAHTTGLTVASPGTS
ncbi:MAG: type II toxin-antitoxin system VapC family toxin [Pseudonocardiaceae bacterium]